MTNITVYSKSNCMQCTATTRILDSAGLEYELVDLEQDDEALQLVRDMGYTAAPVVVTDTGHWSGFNPTRLKALTTPAAPAGPSM